MAHNRTVNAAALFREASLTGSSPRSRQTDLLTSVAVNRSHFEPAVSRFGLEILAPADALRRLEHRL